MLDPHSRPLRLPLPMSCSVPILSDSSLQITCHPQLRFYPERLLLKEADHWQINAMHVTGRTGALVKDLPGTLFAAHVQGRFPGCGEIEIPAGGDLIVQATYTGPRESGGILEACVFGSDSPPGSGKPTRNRKIEEVSSGCSIAPCTSVRLSTDPVTRDEWPSQLVIKEASNWVVNDVLVGGVSIFVQSGDVPGSMFSGGAEDGICLGHLRPGDTFAVVATYVGSEPCGAPFAYELYGARDEAEARDSPVATILPLSSGVYVAPTLSAQITGRCQPPDRTRRGIGPGQGFLGGRITVEDAADWVINDLKIGRASQFAQSGDLPGLAFGPGTLGNAVSLDVARCGLDVAIVTTHVGSREGGRAFYCGILGTIVDLGEPRRLLSIYDLGQ